MYCEAHPAAEPAKKMFRRSMATHMGFAVPNCRDKKDDRGAEKLKWVDPAQRALYNGKWWDMDQHNKQLMQSKTARRDLCRNLPCQDIDDAHYKFYDNKIFYKSFSKHHNIGSRVHVYCPADPAAEPVEVPPAPASPPKAASAASAPAPKPPKAAQAASAPAAPAQADRSPAWSVDYQLTEGGPAFKPVPPGTPISPGIFLPRPGPGFKSPPSPNARPPVAPETEVPADSDATEAAALPATTSTSSAATQQQPDHYVPPRAKTPPPAKAVAKAAAAPAVPAKPRPAGSSASSSGAAPQAAEPADILQTTLGRQRVRFGADVQFTRPLQPRRDDSLGWLQQHNLESYSVGLEFLHQCRGLSEEMTSECRQFVEQKRPLWLSQTFGARVLADILGQAAEPGNIEVFNVRSSFFDPERDGDRTYHTGYFPENLENFAKQTGFQPWLEDVLDRIFCQSEATRTLAAEPGQAAVPGTIHCLMWCNKGTHRSVSACRILSFVAGELKMNSLLSCIKVFFFFSFFFF